MPVKQKITADIKDVQRKNKELERQVDRLTKDLVGMKGAARDYGRAQTQASSEATRWIRQTETAQERHNRKLRSLRDLLQRGRLSMDQFRRSVRLVNREYLNASINSDRAFGSGFGSKIASAAGGLLTLSAAMHGVVSALGEIGEKAQEASEKLDTTFETTADLAQVADLEGPFDLAGLREQSDKIFASGLTRTKAEAERIIFSLKSANLLTEENVQFAVRSSGFFTPKVAQQIAAFASGFSGEGVDDIGSLEDLLSKAVIAAKTTPTANLADILEQASTRAGQAAALGLTDEELFALTSIATRSTTPAIAGTRVQSLLKRFTELGFGGQGFTLEEMTEKLLAKVQEEGVTEAVPNIRAQLLVNDLQKLRRGQLGEEVSAVERGQEEKSIQQVILQLQQDRQFQANLERRAAENTLDLKREQLAVEQAINEAVFARTEAMSATGVIPGLGLLERATGFAGPGLGARIRNRPLDPFDPLAFTPAAPFSLLPAFFDGRSSLPTTDIDKFSSATDNLSEAADKIVDAATRPTGGAATVDEN